MEMKKNNEPIFHDKTEQEICKEIENYLTEKNGFPIPSLEDFCVKYNYSASELKEKTILNQSLKYAVDKIKSRAIVTLENFLLLDVSKIEFKKDNGKSYKLDKKGIIYQLNKIKK